MEGAQENTAATTLLSWISPSLSLVTLTLGVVIAVKLLMPRSLPANIPPFPVKPYPVFGHLPYFKDSQRPKYQQWRAQAGDIYSLLFGSKLFVVICSHKLLKEAFVKKADSLSDRAPVPHVDNADEGLIFSNGRLWKEHRTLSINILRSFGFGKSSMAVRISEEIPVYVEAIANLKGKASDVRTITSTALANITCSIIVGRRFDYSDKLFLSFIKAFTVMVELSEAVSPVVIWPWLRFIPGNFLQSKSLNNAIIHVQENFNEKFLELGEKCPDQENYIVSYLKEMKELAEQGKPTTLSRMNLKRTITHLFLAGTETTSTTLQWFMVYMLQAPDIQAKVFHEIESVVGTERLSELSDQANLPYTMAVIRETQRLSSILPLNLPHWCIADTEIAGYTIPANTTVIGSLDSVLHDPEVWDEPMKFKPERFLDAEGKLINREENIPFSLGRRMCMGDSLAKMELFLFVTAIIQRFELQTPSGKRLPHWTYKDGITCPPQPCKICFVDRKSRV